MDLLDTARLFGAEEIQQGIDRSRHARRLAARARRAQRPAPTGSILQGFRARLPYGPRVNPRILLIFLALSCGLRAGVDVDIEAFGESLGGWDKGDRTADYERSGSKYRTFRPEITPTPDGGIFVSLRVDHIRGWLASDDHAVLEVAFGPDGSVTTAQSSLAIQGRTITSDLIRSGAAVGETVPGVGGAVKVGTDLVADLSSKILREKIVEAGRVSFPSALRHNYNLLVKAIRVLPEFDPHGASSPDEPQADSEAASNAGVRPLEIKPFRPGRD